MTWTRQSFSERITPDKKYNVWQSNWWFFKPPILVFTFIISNASNLGGRGFPLLRWAIAMAIGITNIKFSTVSRIICKLCKNSFQFIYRNKIEVVKKFIFQNKKKQPNSLSAQIWIIFCIRFFNSTFHFADNWSIMRS